MMTYNVFANVSGRLAAALLQQDQVSLAAGVCGLGLRVGSGLGFLLPSFLFVGLSPVSDIDEIGRRLRYWDCSLLVSSVICFLLFFVFYKTDNENGSAAERRRCSLVQVLTMEQLDIIDRGIGVELFMVDLRLLVRSLFGMLKRKPVLLLLCGNSILAMMIQTFPAFYGQMMAQYLDNDEKIPGRELN